MRSLLKNKSGQVESIIVFVMLVVAIFMVSIVVIKLVGTIVTPFASQIGNMSAPAGQAVTYAQNKFTNFWDIAIVMLFFINVILLLVSSFFIDVHPSFIILYIIAIIFLFIFGNYPLYALDSLWNNLAPSNTAEGASIIAHSPMQIFLINNFQLVMLGVVILSGIVMYAKFKFFGQGEGAGGNY